MISEDTNSASSAREEPVAVEAAGMTVHGTLTLPATATPAPALLMIAGYGPTDRDWNSPRIPGTNGSGRLIAHALAERGFATLRYDKRGSGQTGPAPHNISWPDYEAEQRALLALLAAHPSIDPHQIALLGHTEGSVHALHLIEQDPDTPVHKLIFLAAAGRPLRDVLLDLIHEQLAVSKLPDSQLALHQRHLKAQLNAIIAGGHVEPGVASPYTGVQHLVSAIQAPLVIDYARAVLAFDPLAAAARARRPQLVICGDRDIYMDCERDAAPLARAGGHLVWLPEADHMLKHQTLPREALTLDHNMLHNAPDRTLAPGLIDAIARFLAAP